jgi:hypothetical protein
MGIQYDHIWYQKCPHFIVGIANQWGENGYLFYEGEVYSYMADRHEQYDVVTDKMSVPIFIDYAKRNKIEVPESFLKVIINL